MTLDDIAKQFPVGRRVRYWPAPGYPYFSVHTVASAPRQNAGGVIVLDITGVMSAVPHGHLMPMPDNPSQDFDRAGNPRRPT